MNKAKSFFRNRFMMSVSSIMLGFVAAIIIVALTGYDPWMFISTLINGIIGNPKRILNVLITSTPIIFTGVGVAFAIHAGIFNIGAEGQFIMGSVATVVAGILFDFPPVIEIPLLIAAGTAAGAVYGGLTGILKAKFGINEVITSIMLNWVALYFSNLVIKQNIFNNSVLSRKISESGYTTLLNNWKKTVDYSEVAGNPWKEAVFKTDMNAGIIAAILIAIFVSWLLFRTKKGFELRAVGINPCAARFTGINVQKNIVQSMMISGAICGLGAAFYITGQWPHCLSTLSGFEGYGMNGISVAFIAMGSPVGCIPAGLLFGGLLFGGNSVQLLMGVPTEIINIAIGLIVFFCAMTKMFSEIIERMFSIRGNHANVRISGGKS